MCWKNCDGMFSHFDIVYECDEQTDRRTGKETCHVYSKLCKGSRGVSCQVNSKLKTRIVSNTFTVTGCYCLQWEYGGMTPSWCAETISPPGHIHPRRLSSPGRILSRVPVSASFSKIPRFVGRLGSGSSLGVILGGIISKGELSNGTLPSLFRSRRTRSFKVTIRIILLQSLHYHIIYTATLYDMLEFIGASLNVSSGTDLEIERPSVNLLCVYLHAVKRFITHAVCQLTELVAWLW